MAEHTRTFGALYEAYTAGQLDRRAFMAKAAALGVGFPVVAFLLRTADARAAAPDATSIHIGSRLQDASTEAPSLGTEGKSRGSDGELRLLQWQAPTQLAAHYATGTKDFLAADLVNEPLMRYLPDGTLLANLITEVPSVENGMLAEDLTSVTFKLMDGVVWADGEPFTAADVAFTHQFIIESVDTETISVNYETWSAISAIEATDDLTATVTFAEPNINWFLAFTGGTYAPIYPKHYIEANGGPEIMINEPLGTGPYKVDSFSPGDQVIYSINENYRYPDKPYFATVNLKGGGDAASAAQAVLQTGDWDHAWNLQVEPAILNNYAEAGQGRLIVTQGTSLERININFSDPNKEGANGQRSYIGNPHPFLTDIEVRRAMNVAIDRDLIANQFYFGDQGEPATANVLNGLESFASPNTSFTFDTDKGNQILEDAGWTLNGSIREKDGVQLKLAYSTSINLVRQKTQAVVKQGLEAIGFQVSLQQVDSGVFFDGSAGNPQNIGHMYVDINMYTSNADSPAPIGYMTNWYAGTNNANIAQQENGWLGQNFPRYVNPNYDALYERLQLESDLEAAAELLIQMNDILINDVALIPEVNRGSTYAAHESLFHGEGTTDNAANSPFENNYWNVANWNRSTPIDR